ncbi:hypothetical protein B0J14DRAFT_216630 [Halenospora varia]|nr:hypothetical protein B0J14DRAFT_216630 [Halenospora varia]
MAKSTSFMTALPLEVFRTVMDQIVTTIGVKEGARLRIVCKLFKEVIPLSMITVHAFANHPPFFFFNPSENHYIIEYIVHHILTEGKSRKNFAARLFQVLEAISPNLKPEDEEFKIRLRALVLGLARAYRLGLVRELLSENGNAVQYLKEDTFKTDCLRTAALLGLPEKFTEIAAAYTEPGGEELDIHSYPHAGLFLCPSLEYAAQGGHFDLVCKILDGLENEGLLPIESH